jgi:hypothetical protein
MIRLTHFENIIKYATGFITAPIAPLYLFSVKTNTKSVILRYGKIDRIVNPGLRWAPPGCKIYNVFTGTRIHSIKNLKLIDSIGMPIIVSVNIEYHIKDVELFIINTNNNNDIIINIILKKIFSYLTLNNKDLKKNNIIISNEILNSINNFGFFIDSINIIEINYAPEIAKQMLIKQETLSYIEARKEIINYTINVIKNVVSNLPEISKNTQEKIIINLLTLLINNNTHKL